VAISFKARGLDRRRDINSISKRLVLVQAKKHRLLAIAA
jgi:hypothetical protein